VLDLAFVGLCPRTEFVPTRMPLARLVPAKINNVCSDFDVIPEHMTVSCTVADVYTLAMKSLFLYTTL